MAKTKVKLHIAGFNELRKRGEVEAVVSGEAERIAVKAGEGFEVGVHQMGNRVIANVYTQTADAMRAEAKAGALSKAVGGG
ncbi:hypothetical protein AOZ07_03080 [Glutamicibacter halophytocola]|uniref:hypothetical protein n=1 Tax=Glutamicibacter halophytocola TaxID=1933880 RepID=UPI0006D49CE6|nr:hypothetical protein [Glutamicibacter halophytocola]ALG28082.1 hypothetical protein AOZ07_03080 [Glutamicibacter halophytocola]